MISKPCLALLALATLSANGVLAVARHPNHGQRHLQHQKKDLVFETTTTVTDVTWTTVFVDNDGDAVAAPSAAGDAAVASSAPAQVSASSSSSVIASTPSTTSSSSVVVPTTSSTVAPTTLVTSAAPVTTADAAVAIAKASTTSSSNLIDDIASVATAAAASLTSDVAAVATALTSSSSSSGNKRGAAYNDATLVDSLTGTGSKISWAYNWGATSSGLSSDLEFVPMLWCSTSTYPDDWTTNAQSAIDSGSKYLLSFNEPDNPSQCNIDASTAATAHIKYMNPFSSKAGIGAPAITNSNTEGQSLDWLADWISACGDECDFDFCPVHWYNTIEAGAADLLEFVTKASSTCGSDKDIWVTEFAPNVDSPSDEEISSFLETVQDAFDNNSTYSFVSRYSYFYVSDGLLVSGTSASTYGNTYAYS